MNRTSLSLLSLISAGILLQCGGDKKPADAPATAVSLSPAELPPEPSNQDAGAPPQSLKAANDMNAPDAGTPGAANPTAATPPAANAESLTDGQIAGVTDTANTGEIEQAKVARLKSKDPAVQRFAAKMIAAHEEAKKNQDQLKIPTEESPLGNSFGTASASTMTTLKSAEASDFDKAYIDAQVAQHQKLSDALHDKLIASAKNPDLKAYLTRIQPHIARHLKEAQDIQRDLQAKIAAGGDAKPSGAPSTGKPGAPAGKPKPGK